MTIRFSTIHCCNNHLLVSTCVGQSKDFVTSSISSYFEWSTYLYAYVKNSLKKFSYYGFSTSDRIKLIKLKKEIQNTYSFLIKHDN